MASCRAQAEIEAENTGGNLHVNQVVNSRSSYGVFWGCAAKDRSGGLMHPVDNPGVNLHGQLFVCLSTGSGAGA